MADDAKQLRFEVVVNHSSAEQAKRVLREITVEVSRLTSELNRAAQAGGGGLFGGATMRGGAGGGGSSPVAAGGSSRGGFAPSSGGGGPAGAANSLVGSLLENKNVLKGVAFESRDAMRLMSEAVRAGLYHQRNEVERLRGEVGKLVQEYQKLGREQQGLTGFAPDLARQVGAERSQVGERFVDASARLGRAQGAVRDLEGQERAQGFGSRAQEQVKALVQKVSSNPYVRGALALGAVYEAGSALYYNTQQATAGEALKNDFLARGARAGGSVGAMGMQVRRGGLAEQLALERLFESGEAGRILGRSPHGVGGNLAADALGVLGGSPGNQTEAREMLAKTGTGMTGIRQYNPFGYAERHFAYKRAMGNVSAEEMERLTEAARQQAQMEVRNSTYSSEFMGEYGSRMAQTRMFGVGDAKRQIDPATGQSWAVIDARTGRSKTFNSAAQAGFGSNFSSPEVAAMSGQLGQVAGRGFIGRGNALGILGYQAGGLGNAAEMFGMASQYGSGFGFLRALSGGAGGRGLDVTAAGQLGGMVGGSLMGGGTGGMTSGMGAEALRGFMSMAAGGGPGQDMRGARIVNQGADAYNNMILRGGMDPLQKGINVLASIRAGSDLSLYGRHRLEQMNAVEAAGILRTGKVPQAFSDRGITAGHVGRYLEEQQQLQYSRYLSGTAGAGGGGAVEDAVRGARGKGTAEYFRGLKPSERPGKLRLLAEAGADQSGGQISEAQYEGILRAQLAGYKDLAPGLAGSGIGDPAARTLEAQAKRGQDVAARGDYEKFLADNRDAISTAVRATKTWADALDHFSTTTGQSSAAFVAAVDAMTATMTRFVNSPAMRKFAPINPRAGAPGGH